ncbi:MAG: hypothetical protein JW953_05480 [Anaerolineae bacterium]|nr:hypothetical protein [Anaerolineae bacterium]
MSYGQPEKLSAEEENKLARRGACLAVVVLPMICCCLFGLFTSYTTDGRILASKFFLYSTYHGNIIGFVGFSDIAKSSCALDRLTPKPSSYDKDQYALETRYRNNLRIYRKYWQELKKNGGDPGEYPLPTHLPQTFAQAKAKYCR